MEGTAVASTVESMATNPVLSMTEMSTGPRSERNPTAGIDVELTDTKLRPPAEGGSGRALAEVVQRCPEIGVEGDDLVDPHRLHRPARARAVGDDTEPLVDATGGAMPVEQDRHPC